MTEDLGQAISDLARRRGLTLAVAESLTGGLLANALAVAPAAAEWFRGGIVAYSPEVKQDLLGVHAGPMVTARCAAEMAVGAIKVLGADLAVAVSGVGGPEPEEGQPAGTVWIAVTGEGRVETQRCQFPGTPAEVCRSTCEAALHLLLGHLEGPA